MLSQSLVGLTIMGSLDELTNLKFISGLPPNAVRIGRAAGKRRIAEGLMTADVS
jgi:hypothetical protein